MEGKSFFSWLRGRTKVVATLLFFFSYWGSQHRINSWTFFFPALHSGEALVYLCSIQLFAEASSWDFFLLSWVGGCVFLTKNPMDRPTGWVFFEQGSVPEACGGCAAACAGCLGHRIWSETKSARHMMWLPTIVLEIWGISKKKQRHPAIGHVAFGMGVLLKFWKVPSWQVGACHQEAGGSWIERTRKTFMSCLRVWVS